MSKIIVSGSITYDYIMKSNQAYQDIFLPEQLDQLSVSFLVPEMSKSRGGTTYNIAYNLGLLDMKDTTIMLGCIGKDYKIDQKSEKYINFSYTKRIDDKFTACAYVITDKDHNQITPFHPGAMLESENQSLKAIDEEIKYVLISPNMPEAMIKHLDEGKELKAKVFFDPGQNITLFDKETLLHAAKKADYLIVNEYERNLMQQITELEDQDIRQLFDKVIITLGKEGTKIMDITSSQHIHGAKIMNPVDPTGAGDSFRAWLLTWLFTWKPREESIKLWNIIASFVVESQGTANHEPSIEQIKKRYQTTYGEELIM